MTINKISSFFIIMLSCLAWVDASGFGRIMLTKEYRPSEQDTVHYLSVTTDFESDPIDPRLKNWFQALQEIRRHSCEYGSPSGFRPRRPLFCLLKPTESQNQNNEIIDPLKNGSTIGKKLHEIIRILRRCLPGIQIHWLDDHQGFIFGMPVHYSWLR